MARGADPRAASAHQALATDLRARQVHPGFVNPQLDEVLRGRRSGRMSVSLDSILRTRAVNVVGCRFAVRFRQAPEQVRSLHQQIIATSVARSPGDPVGEATAPRQACAEPGAAPPPGWPPV